MPSAKRAAAKPRKRTPRKRTSRKRLPPPAKTPPRRPRVAPYQSCTPEMEANLKRRYEETDEPVASIAADRGIAPGSLRRFAYARGWVRRKHRPPTDVTTAMRLLAETERLEAEVASPAAGPSTPTGLGSPTESDAASSRDLYLATIARIEAGVRAELATVEAMRAAYGAEPYKPYHAQLTTRTLSNLTDTLGKLTRLRAALAPQPAASPPAGITHDDIPADIDEFRDALARRIEAFLESREAERDAERDAAPAMVDDAR